MSIDDLLYAPIVTQSELIVPESWFSVVRALRGYSNTWKNTTIAGGALRDLDLGRPIKDVDIFMPFEGEMHDFLYEAMEDLDIDCIDEIEHDAKAASGGCPANHYTFELDGWHYEVSQRYEKLLDHRQILDTFDLGICMICLDGEKVYRAPSYHEDVRNHTISVIRKTGGREMEHAKRLLSKYAGWVVVPLDRP